MERFYHKFDLQLGYLTIHADEVTEEDLKNVDNLLVENVRWRGDKPNRKGRLLPEVMEIIKDYPNVGIAYDVAHGYINDEPMEEIINYKDRITLFHLTDTIGKGDRHLPLYKGEINWEKFFRILGEINYRGFLVIEK